MAKGQRRREDEEAARARRQSGSSAATDSLTDSAASKAGVEALAAPYASCSICRPPSDSMGGPP